MFPESLSIKPFIASIHDLLRFCFLESRFQNCNNHLMMVRDSSRNNFGILKRLAGICEEKVNTGRIID